jgi:putative ABC transport system permease protein
MQKNYFKLAFRNLRRNKAHSFINIAGLSVGMTVALLIGLWIWDELSYDKYHDNYARIAQVEQHTTVNGTVHSGATVPMPLGDELRKNFGSDFKQVVLSSWTNNHVLTVGDKKLSISGNFMEAGAPNLFSLVILKGTSGLTDPSSILLDQSSATALFGDADPVNQLVKLDNDQSFKVTGVYEDLPDNTTMKGLSFIAPWEYYQTITGERARTDWNDNYYLLYVQVAGNADMAKLSEKIKDTRLNKLSKDAAGYHPQLFLHAMNKWHLYAEYKNGVNVGGRIQYVWLFGTIGLFVLLLACINFMNLSTARSEKRAKEVGVRKAIGSLRRQLIGQFFSESVLVALLAFVLSLLLASLALGFFNEVAGKKMYILWGSPLFWLAGIGFSVLTGLIAGSYPAFYLSSFRPVKVLKGTFKAGPLAAIPRKALVVLQFTVSVVLIIGTIIVFKQVQYARDRPVGYDRDGLVIMETTTSDLHDHFNALRNDLIASGAVVEIAESSSPTTGVNNDRNDVEWDGKDPSLNGGFGSVRVTTGYGKTVGWQFAAGRDFSSQLATDSSAVVLNEAAVAYMGLKDPVGKTIRFKKRDHLVIGVIRNMVMQSPYKPVKQALFFLAPQDVEYINIKINPAMNAHDAMNKIAAVCKVYSPSVPFSYKFADEEYARKFSDEERIGKLATVFAVLAIFISCLGLFGMATFMAEQRIKEIGVRKILGASIFNLWGLLSREFVTLVLIALVIALPLAYYFMYNWLQNYAYRSAMPWWVFAAAAAGALLITVLTVSYQSIKAALTNPVKSLRSE